MTRMATLLAALAMIGPFAVDTYLPSFPAIQADLAVSVVQVQQTLSLYLIAFAVMTLFHGTLSDSFGRRPIVLVNLALFAAASAGCALASSFEQLLMFRALQGASAGAGIVVGRAMIRDSLEGHAAQRLMSLVTMIFGLAPAIAPIIGGWLQGAFGWRSVFVFPWATVCCSCSRATSDYPKRCHTHNGRCFSSARLRAITGRWAAAFRSSSCRLRLR